MSDVRIAESLLDAEDRPRGRSPWRDAWLRLRRNRAAMVSLAVLALVSIICFLGPALSPHAPQTVYRNYVKVAPSLEAHPRADAVEATIASALRRARVEVLETEVVGETVRVTLRSARDGALDERITRYVERPADFSNARLVETLEGGRGAIVEADVARIRFLMGTDANGRDLMTRIFVGGQISILIGLLAAFVAVVIGVVYGATAGYVGGRVDDAMMRIVDILYSLPFIFFVILLVVFFGRNVFLMFIAVGAVEWLDMARIVRGQTLSIVRQEYVEAARALGVRGPAILGRHVIPNALGPVVIYMTLLVPKVILLESFLSFLGLGVPEPLTSWGVLISEGARNIQGAPWLLLFPSIFLTTTLFCLNFVGDGLRDALDPKDR